MTKNAFSYNSPITMSISRLKATMRPISLNATFDNNPKLTFKMDHVGKR